LNRKSVINNIFYCFLCSLFITNSAFSVELTPKHPSLTINNASKFLTRLSPNEGLSQSYVTKTIQDQQGFIWIATDLGLNRYDGYQVQQILGPNKVFLKASISTLFLDQQGYLWVSTLYSGLYRLDTKTFAAKQFFTGKFSKNTSEISEVIAIKQAQEGNLWLAISGRVLLLNVTTGKLTQYLALKEKDHIVRDLLVSGKWLFCATSKGMYRINIATKAVNWFEHRPKNYTDEDSLNSKFLLVDKKLGLLVGTVNGLFALTNYQAENYKQIKTIPLIKNFNIWRVLPFGKNFLVATDKGLYQYSPKNNKLQFVLRFSDSPFQITDNNIIDLFADRTGNIWLASRSQGVMIWSPLTRRFQNISASTTPKLSHDNVWSLLQDDHYLWIGTDNGLDRLDLDNGNIDYYLVEQDSKSIYGDHVIRQILMNNKNEHLLWLVTDLGLRIFNKQTGKISNPKYTAKSKAMIKDKWLSGFSFIDKQHILFFSEKSHYVYNSLTGEITPLTALNNATPIELSWGFLGKIAPQSNDVLLTTSGHLYRYNLTTQKLKKIYKSLNYQPQAYDYVDNVVLDKNNILWLAMSGEGLIGLDYKTLVEKYRFDTSNGLRTNSIYSLQLDEQNNLWFSSQMGLYRLDQKRKYIESFTALDGLLANEFNSGAYTKLSDGRLVFGSTRGITLLTPQDFVLTNKELNDYQVSVVDIKLYPAQKEQNLYLKNKHNITLNYDDYGLKLYFSTLQYLQQQRTHYNIDLEGPSPLHFKNVKKHELFLSKLPVGKYQLMITAINPITGINSKPLNITINSLQAPWLTTPAKIIYALIVFLIIFSYQRIRANQQRQLQQEHEKLQASQIQIQLALNASNSGIWDYQVDKNILFESTTTTGFMQQRESSLEQRFALIHYDDQAYVRQQWTQFIEQGDHDLDICFRIKSDDGEWQWYKDIGAVIKRDEQGKPLRVSGTYTNITKEKTNEAQMLLFGEAFRQINDWVLILDERKQPVTANKAFMSFFASDHHTDVPSLAYFLSLIGEQKYQEFSEIIDRIKPGESWQGEEVVATKTNEQHPVLVKINAIAADGKKINHYVIVISDISMQKNAEEKLRHLAHYDYLTNLPNRKLILEKIDHTIAEYKGTEHKSALFFIDLDKFKQVNDSLGHHAGDELLKYVADTLIANVKSRDLVARQSGDEFMILIESFTHLEDLTRLAQRINHCLTKPLKIMASQVNISSSIGIAIFPDDATDSTELIRKADLAMIHAKQSGRSQFQFYTQKMNAQAQRRLALENELIDAVKQNEFVNFYQPIVNCTSKKVVGFELLMRWPHKNGMISPMEFIPVAEEIGLISQMTEQALERALSDYPLLQKQFNNCYISVNLSAIHILQQGLSQTLKDLLTKHQLPASALRLEITEGTLLVDKATALHRLNELKALGFKLLLDDFGTGYSSLTYLSQFPIDVLKIDQSFVRNLQTNPVNKPIIQAIILLAQNLGLSCIAEGIEDIEHLDYIRALGCDKIQGYYFSKPAPIETITETDFFQNITNKLNAI